MQTYPVVIIGSGVSGMMAAIHLASLGIKSCLVSHKPFMCAGSVTDAVGINADHVFQTQKESEQHVYDTIRFSGLLANQKLVYDMCDKAGFIVKLLERMGVFYLRAKDGSYQIKKKKGSQNPRTFEGQVNLGRQVVTALAEQVLYYQSKGFIKQKNGCEFLSIITNKDRCAGVILRDLKNMKPIVVGAQSVVMATGSVGQIYGNHTTQPVYTTSRAIISLYEQGVALSNPEFAVVNDHMTHWLGGLWVDENHNTTMPNLYAIGECAAGYHGADLMPGNGLLSLIHSGWRVAHVIDKENLETNLSDSWVEEVLKKENANLLEYKDLSGPENLQALHQELAGLMFEYMGPVREEGALVYALEKIADLKDRWQRVSVTDYSDSFNFELVFVRELQGMFKLAEIMIIAALARQESRGVHQRKDHLEKNDKKYLKTTKVINENEKPKIYYEDVNRI